MLGTCGHTFILGCHLRCSYYMYKGKRSTCVGSRRCEIKKMGEWGVEKRKENIKCISLASLWPNPPLVKHPFTIQNCGIENLVYHVFHSKITYALQARSCWDFFFNFRRLKILHKQWHHQTFLYRMSEKKASVESHLRYSLFFMCV